MGEYFKSLMAVEHQVPPRTTGKCGLEPQALVEN
jgi:hypothetical protein